MYVEFIRPKKLRKSLNAKKQYSLTEASQTIAETQGTSLKNKVHQEVEFRIFDNSEMIYSDLLHFGEPNNYMNNLILIIQNTFQTILKDQPKAEAEEFIDKISQAMSAEVANQPIEKVSQQIPQEGIEDSSIVEPTTIEPVVKKVVKAKTPKKPLPKLKKHLEKKKVFRFIAIIITTTLLIVAIITVKAIRDAANTVMPYETLIAKKEYLAAGEAYPKKRSDIEQILINKDKIKTLTKFNGLYPTNNGSFDLAFYNQNYKKTIKLSDKTKMDQTRKAKLAVAYVKVNEFDSAQLLNAELQNEKLAIAIAIGYIRQGQFDKASEINKSLQDTTIAKAIETGKVYQAAIEKYQADSKDTSKTAKERADAVNNLKTFKHQLKSLGE